MPLYKYEGLRKDGSRIKGDLMCQDETTLKATLAKDQIALVTFNEVKTRQFGRMYSLTGTISKKEFIQFVTQLSIMIQAGTSIANAINILRNQNFSMYFKSILSNIYEDVLSGTYLSKSLEKYPAVFPSFFVSMVYVGELSGSLDMVLRKSVTYYENDMKMKKKAKSAMIYPTFLFVIVMLVFFLLMIFVVPKFTEMIDSFGGEVPKLTQIISNISAFVVDNVLYLLGGIVILVIGGIVFFKKTKAGKKTKDWLGYHLPVFSKITTNTITTRFCNAFFILLTSGMKVIDCMNSMPKIIDNNEFTKRFKVAINDVSGGSRLNLALKRTKIFPDMVYEMTAVGEQSASLKEVYDIVAKYYEEELASSIQRATGLLEPIAIIFLGVMVLVIILAILLPMFSLMNAIN